MLEKISREVIPSGRAEDAFDAVEALPFFSSFDPWDADTHAQYLRLADQSEKHRQMLAARLTLESGRTFAEMTLDHQLFLKIRHLQAHLEGERYHDMPYLDQSLKTGDALILAKIFGSPDRIDAFLDSYAPHNLDERLKCRPDACLNLINAFDRQGAASGSISFLFRAVLDDPSNPRDDYYAQCELSTFAMDGEWRTEVKLHTLELDQSLQTKGAGSKRFADSLLWCLEQEVYGTPIDSITLRANIDVGGYAWSLYGFDFDDEGWVSELPAPHEQQRRNNLSPQERRKEIVTPILDASEQFFGCIMQEGSDPSSTQAIHQARSCLQALRELLDHPETYDLVTPESIASIGIDQPKVTRCSNGAFYIGPVPPDQTPVREGHLGKFFMLGSSWLGKLPLKPSNPHENPALKSAFQRLHIPL